MPPYMITSGFLALILVRIALKSVALSLVYSRATIVAPGGLGGLLGLVGQARAVRGLVVDDGDLLGAERRDGFLADDAALLHVVGHDAERGLEALQRVLRIGRRRRDLRNAGVAVELGGGNRRARVQVADDAGDLGVDQLLRDDRALLRVGLVVFGDELELDLLAVDHDVLGVGIVDRQAGAVLVVLAQVRLRAGRRADVADLDDGFGHGRRGRRAAGGFCGLLRLFLAAAVSGQQRCGDKRQAERAIESHECPPLRGVIGKAGSAKLLVGRRMLSIALPHPSVSFRPARLALHRRLPRLPPGAGVSSALACVDGGRKPRLAPFESAPSARRIQPACTGARLQPCKAPGGLDPAHRYEGTYCVMGRWFTRRRTVGALVAIAVVRCSCRRHCRAVESARVRGDG